MIPGTVQDVQGTFHKQYFVNFDDGDKGWKHSRWVYKMYNLNQATCHEKKEKKHETN